MFHNKRALFLLYGHFQTTVMSDRSDVSACMSRWQSRVWWCARGRGRATTRSGTSTCSPHSSSSRSTTIVDLNQFNLNNISFKISSTKIVINVILLPLHKIMRHVQQPCLQFPENCWFLVLVELNYFSHG